MVKEINMFRKASFVKKNWDRLAKIRPFAWKPGMEDEKREIAEEARVAIGYARSTFHADILRSLIKTFDALEAAKKEYE